jgi:hypothetical protein
MLTSPAVLIPFISHSLFIERGLFMEKIGKNLSGINKALEHQNEIMLKMAEAMQKPQSPFMRVLTLFGTIVSFFSIVNAIDTIMKWFKGVT